VVIEVNSWQILLLRYQTDKSRRYGRWNFMEGTSFVYDGDSRGQINFLAHQCKSTSSASPSHLRTTAVLSIVGSESEACGST
jgi:hypothetical protein